MAVLSGFLLGCGSSPVVPGAPPSTPRTTNDSAIDVKIAGAQERLRTNDKNVGALSDLAAAYLQKIRESGDPTYYSKVEGLLKRAVRLAPDDVQVADLTGLLQLARHQFAAARDTGDRAHALAPTDGAALAVLGDADNELGRYEEASAAIQQMVDRHPNLGAYSRVSYIRELHGDVPGAIEAMKLAVTAGGPYAENVAYVQVLLGNLELLEGHTAAAEQAYQAALGADPKYPAAQAALALVRIGQGRVGEAITLDRSATALVPLPQYVVALGDAQTLAGDQKGAEETYAVAVAEQRLYQANGVVQDQELALFDADHQRDLPAAVDAARRAVADRPSVQSFDVLGWCLYRAGAHDAEALTAARASHRLGTRDPAFFFHSGMIEARMGMVREARADLQTALDINPHFNELRVRELRATLAGLPA